jgi:hypothetical protein
LPSSVSSSILEDPKFKLSLLLLLLLSTISGKVNKVSSTSKRRNENVWGFKKKIPPIICLFVSLFES